ncbi:unnamed protein product [Camellia sinensis]
MCFSLNFCYDFAYTAFILCVLIQVDALRTEIHDNYNPPLPAEVVWFANPNHHVKLTSTLKLTQDGDLILVDANGTSIWSTNTGGGGGGGGGGGEGKYSVSGLNLTKDGNLVLFDQNNAMVWQSFDHPTDSLLFRQTLVNGQNLTTSASVFNWTQDVLTSDISDCGYPMACGNYGICSPNRQCGCLEETATSNTSMQINYRNPILDVPF